MIGAANDDSLVFAGPEMLENYWVEIKRAKPNFEAAKRSKGGCVAIGFIIESDGNTSTLSVIGSFPSDALDEALVDSLRRTHYRPAERNPGRNPVFTVIVTGMYKQVGRLRDIDIELQAKVKEVCQRLADDWLVRRMKN